MASSAPITSRQNLRGSHLQITSDNSTYRSLPAESLPDKQDFSSTKQTYIPTHQSTRGHRPSEADYLLGARVDCPKPSTQKSSLTEIMRDAAPEIEREPVLKSKLHTVSNAGEAKQAKIMTKAKTDLMESQASMGLQGERHLRVSFSADQLDSLPFRPQQVTSELKNARQFLAEALLLRRIVGGKAIERRILSISQQLTVRHYDKFVASNMGSLRHLKEGPLKLEELATKDMEQNYTPRPSGYATWTRTLDDFALLYVTQLNAERIRGFKVNENANEMANEKANENMIEKIKFDKAVDRLFDYLIKHNVDEEEADKLVREAAEAF